ncbi:hypothetical protein ARMSODRAFT_784173 [Armillaria solidipes]|uniref:Uncharacterized protein n=1 Tax=Armillaria solidipes TaxID=1076256 RepID=A0A2H3C698_9AGAR|nr:hypothetical protein ARMSODRAFT_784173 [Armillaria solidipes]
MESPALIEEASGLELSGFYYCGGSVSWTKPVSVIFYHLTRRVMRVRFDSPGETTIARPCSTLISDPNDLNPPCCLWLYGQHDSSILNGRLYHSKADRRR